MKQPSAHETFPAVRLFDLIWTTISDLLGTAATATLFRRSAKRAAVRVPALGRLEILKDRLTYRYTLPSGWTEGQPGCLDELRELTRELQPLLIELTGPVVLQRLREVPDLQASKLFTGEESS